MMAWLLIALLVISVSLPASGWAVTGPEDCGPGFYFGYVYGVPSCADNPVIFQRSPYPDTSHIFQCYDQMAAAVKAMEGGPLELIEQWQGLETREETARFLATLGAKQEQWDAAKECWAQEYTTPTTTPRLPSGHLQQGADR